MNYSEFIKFIKENDLTISTIEKKFGYSEKSIHNNWKKNNKIPDKALITINLYLKVKEQEQKINNLLNNSINNTLQLSPGAYKIAKEKSLQYNIRIEEYISSLIISNI